MDLCGFDLFFEAKKYKIWIYVFFLCNFALDCVLDLRVFFKYMDLRVFFWFYVFVDLIRVFYVVLHFI